MIMELFLHLSYISQLVFILASICHQKQLPWNNPRKFSNHISLFGVLVSLGYSDHRNLSSHNYRRSEVCSHGVSRARHCRKNPSVGPPACWWWRQPLQCLCLQWCRLSSGGCLPSGCVCACVNTSPSSFSYDNTNLWIRDPTPV